MLRPARTPAVQGVTILLVTHATPTVLALCDRAFFLHGGRLLAHGHPKPVVQQYHRLLLCLPGIRSRPGAGTTRGVRHPLDAELADPGGAGLRPPGTNWPVSTQFPAPQHRQL